MEAESNRGGTLKQKLPDYSLQSTDSKKALITINACKSLDPASTQVKAVDDNSIQFSRGECRNLMDAEDKSGMRLAFPPNAPVAEKPSAASAAARR